MKKTLKLPLFLAAVCLISTGVLAVVNEITAPIIATVELEKKNAGYLDILGLESLANHDIATVATEDALKSKGILQKTTVTEKSSGNVYGIVYDATVGGYAGPMSFQVGFKDGKYAGFNNVSNTETASYGGIIIADLDGLIEGLDATSETSALYAEVKGNYAGKSETWSNITVNALLNAFKLAANDYLASR